MKEVPRVGAFYRLFGHIAICQYREQEASMGLILPLLLLSLRPLLSVKWMFLDLSGVSMGSVLCSLICCSALCLLFWTPTF